jgi:hypothetical protein
MFETFLDKVFNILGLSQPKAAAPKVETKPVAFEEMTKAELIAFGEEVNVHLTMRMKKDTMITLLRAHG